MQNCSMLIVLLLTFAFRPLASPQVESKRSSPPDSQRELTTEQRLKVLNDALVKHGGHLVGGRFTVADLNLVGVVFYLRGTPQALEPFPAIRAWYQAALARPAAKAA